MEIHIDTKRDSDEEIRKTIRFLQSLINDTPNSSAAVNMFDNAPSDSGTGDSATPMNMFGSDDDAPSDYSPNNSNDDDDDAIIEIVEY